MTNSPTSISNKTFGVVIAAAGAVLIWRIAALALLYGQTGSAGSPFRVKTLLAVVGVTFLVCGLLVLAKLPSRASLLFAGFCICSGLHWGGPLELPAGQLRSALLFFYLIVSSFLGEAFLLHLALVFPECTRFADRKVVIRSLYAPVVVASIVAAVYLISPLESGLRSASEGVFLALHLLVSNLFGILALAIYLSYLVRSGLTTTEKRYVGLIVAGMLTAWLPYLIAASLGAETDPWNLTVVALPISFTIAFFGLERARNHESR